MPIVDVIVDSDGRLLVNLAVMISSVDKASRSEDEIFEAYPVQAPVDTGAGQSQIDMNVIQCFGLDDLGEIPVYTASTGNTPELRPRFLVDVFLAGNRHGLLARNLEVIGSDGLGGLRVPMLLGRDILNQCLLSYDGPNRRCSLAYDTPPPP